jgi:hypothetical protein
MEKRKPGRWVPDLQEQSASVVALGEAEIAVAYGAKRGGRWGIYFLKGKILF